MLARVAAVARHGIDDEPLVDLEHGGAFPHVHLPHDGVGYDGDAPHDVRHERRAADGVVAAVGQEQVRLEADEVHLVPVDVFLELGRRVLAGEAVGVVAVGQEEHLDVEPLAQEHVDAAQARLDARHVAVVEHGDVLREAADEAYLPLGERRARRGHDVLHTALVHRDDVGVALDEEAASLPDDGVLGQVEAVELVALVVDGRLGRVDVFRHLLARRHDAASEGHHLARHRVHGEDDAAVVAVEQAAVVRLEAEAGLHEVFPAEPFLRGGARQGVAGGQGEAELELADDVVAEAPLAEVGHAHGLPFGMAREHVGEIVARPLVEDEEALALRLRPLLLGGELLLLHLYAVAAAQPFQCLGIGHLLVLHDEMHDVAALAAAETLAELLRGRHDEARRALVVERAQPLVVHARLAEGDELAHHVHDVGGGHNPVDGFPVYHDVSYRQSYGKETRPARPWAANLAAQSRRATRRDGQPGRRDGQPDEKFARPACIIPLF